MQAVAQRHGCIRQFGRNMTNKPVRNALVQKGINNQMEKGWKRCYQISLMCVLSFLNLNEKVASLSL